MFKKGPMATAAAAIILLVAATFAAERVIDDGEGGSAQIDAFYDTVGGNALREAQMASEEPNVPIPVGNGATKIVFEVTDYIWYSWEKHSFDSPQDFSDYMTGSLEFWFYWRGYDLSEQGRAEGRTQEKLWFYMGDATFAEIGIGINLANEGSAGRLVADQWNKIVIDFTNNPKRSGPWPGFHTGANGYVVHTINGQPIDPNNVETYSNISTWDDFMAMWSGVTYFQWQDNHGGYTGSVEGWYGLDDAKLVFDPQVPAQGYLDDGEGTSNGIDLYYFYDAGEDNNVLREAQMTDEEPNVPIPGGNGATKVVFDVGGTPWRSTRWHSYGSPQDFSDYMDGAVEFEFYYRYSQAADPNDPAQWFTTADREAGATQWILYFDLIDDQNHWIYFQVKLVDDVSPGEAQLGHVNLDAWNPVHIKISDGAFVLTGSTISGNAIDASNFTTSTNISTPEQRQHFWQNITTYTIQENHAGLPAGQHAEGWFGIDELRLRIVPPADCSDVWQKGLGLPSDLNHDCYVNLIDFSILADQWLTCYDPNNPDCQ